MGIPAITKKNNSWPPPRTQTPAAPATTPVVTGTLAETSSLKAGFCRLSYLLAARERVGFAVLQGRRLGLEQCLSGLYIKGKAMPGSIEQADKNAQLGWLAAVLFSGSRRTLKPAVK